jgi:general secretion pathway protein A
MYERFFGLADAPFRLTPDPRYLFLSRKHAEALAHLKLGLKESSGFVCITGEVGTGKTTLLRAFLADLGPDVANAYIFNPPLSALELLKTINAELGLDATTPSRKRLMDALNNHLLAQRQAGRRSIVVIDEAQALPVGVLEQLRLLSNLETTTEKLLRIVLVGQPQLRAVLLHPELIQLNQRITLRWHMGPLSRRETVAYIAHRLAVAAGGPPPRVFTRRAVRRVHKISGGIPRLINLVAHRAMLAAFAADRRLVTSGFVRQAHRELGALPLAPSAPRRRVRPVAWAAAVLAASLGALALGVTRLGWRPVLRLPRVAASSPPETLVALAPAPEPPAPEVVASAPAEAAPEPAPESPPPATPDPSAVAGPPEMAAPSEVAGPSDAPAPPVETPPAPDPPSAPASPDVAGRLAAAPAALSARAAVNSVLAAWHARPLDANEHPLPSDLTLAAHERKLEYLPVMANESMLRLMDLPAVLELRIPDVEGARYAALTGMKQEKVMLLVDGEPAPVDSEFLQRYWTGAAHLFWRDFESLGRSFGREGHGTQVARLQALLKTVGTYRGPVNGVFDPATEAGVIAFQRSRLLVPDGRVGRLTRIVLYAAGSYPRPKLGASS